eukprot:1484133-Pyramimonas_sp.AAC.1
MQLRHLVRHLLQPCEARRATPRPLLTITYYNILTGAPVNLLGTWRSLVSPVRVHSTHTECTYQRSTV